MAVSQPKSLPRCFSRTPVATAVLLALGSPAVLAQQVTVIEEVVVTAQKRTENLQDVPISIATLNNKTLEELNVQNFRDYVQLLPSVTMGPNTGGSLGSGSGNTLVYMRGVTTGADGQATTSQPSVGMYLDEQPITTIQGNLDIHLYDIARVEVLAGPQGTLYGASSQAGTIRIITNKPDPSGFAAGYSLEGNMVDRDDTGYLAEGFVNLPIGDKAAVRLVGWVRSDAGWIDNLEGSRTLKHGTPDDPTDDTVFNNADLAKNNYNTVDVVGGRAALRIDLNDNWTVTPAVQYQKAESEGFWGDDISNCKKGCPFVAGDDNVVHFQKEFSNDKWYQAGLTIEGKISNFDVTYAGNYLNRDADGSFDYSDYSYFYDASDSYGSYFADLWDANNGDPFSGHYFAKDDHYTKKSHELRISSSQENRVRGMLGFFWQEQFHDFDERFKVDGLADVYLLNHFDPTEAQYPGVVYLNRAYRNDKDEAVFGQIAFDITDALELTVGARFFKTENTIAGFFGFGLGLNRPCAPGSLDPVYEDDGSITCTLDPASTEPGAIANGGEGAYASYGAWWSSNGEWRCPSQAQWKTAPCKNFDRITSETDHIGRVNLSWKATDNALVYATWSEGYRPGGINRNPFIAPYLSDFLTNWEVGWKTEWLDNRLQFNGALFLEQWDNIQLSFAGLNGITQVANGPKAEITGTEMQVLWLPSDQLRLSASAAYYDSELKDSFTAFDPDGEVLQVFSPAGTGLPLTPHLKYNVVARYGFALGDFDAHWQGALLYTGDSSSFLDPTANSIAGDLPSSTVFNFSAGIQKDKYSVELYMENVTDENAPMVKTSECSQSVCGYQSYGVRVRPQTIGIRFSQEF